MQEMNAKDCESKIAELQTENGSLRETVKKYERWIISIFLFAQCSFVHDLIGN